MSDYRIPFFCEGHQFLVEDFDPDAPPEIPVVSFNPGRDGWGQVYYRNPGDPSHTESPHWYCPRCYRRWCAGDGLAMRGPVLDRGETMTKIIDADHPPIHDWGGKVFKWERDIDPWHEDAFPDEFKYVGTKGNRKSGWSGLDAWDNVIIFVADTSTNYAPGAVPGGSEETVNDYYFEIRSPNTITIVDGSHEFTLDEPNLEQAIQNVEATRVSYATREAYETQLEMRKQALVFLRMKINEAWERAAAELGAK